MYICSPDKIVQFTRNMLNSRVFLYVDSIQFSYTGK